MPVVNEKVIQQLNPRRREEILQYLELFGYNPDRTILQIHITGFFGKKNYTRQEVELKNRAIKKYGGTSFVVVGRTHNPDIIEKVINPKKKDPLKISPGYVGYLWNKKNPHGIAPHELIPLDFTPIHLTYPSEWKSMFNTKGFMIAMHVPTSFIKDKNRISRYLYRLGKDKFDVRNEWSFLDNLKEFGYYTNNGNTTSSQKKSDNDIEIKNFKEKRSDDPINIIKTRLAKGEITKEEYKELKQALEA